MIKSMTGYGRAREVRNKRDITVEVRSVNNRYLDCTVKMPGMTAASLLPKAAKAAGIEYNELCERIIEESMNARYR